MTSLIYANLPKQPIDRQKPHRRQHLPLPRSGRTTQLRKCFSSEGQVPIPSRRCPAPSTDSAKLLLCKSICSAELSGRRPTPRTPHLGRGQHFGGWGELRDRAASSLINPCSKKKTPTRLPGNTSLRAPPPAPNLSFFCFVSAPCEPRLEVLAAAHVAGPPSAPQNRSAGGEAAALGLGPVTATSGLPESAAPPRAAPPVFSSQAQKKFKKPLWGFLFFF